VRWVYNVTGDTEDCCTASVLIPCISIYSFPVSERCHSQHFSHLISTPVLLNKERITYCSELFEYSSTSCLKKLPNIVDAHRKDKRRTDSFHSSKMRPSHKAVSLEPAENLFNPLLLPDADFITLMPCRSSINSTCLLFRMEILCNMRRNIQLPESCAQIVIIIMLISSDCLWAFCIQRFQSLQSPLHARHNSLLLWLVPAPQNRCGFQTEHAPCSTTVLLSFSTWCTAALQDLSWIHASHCFFSPRENPHSGCPYLHHPFGHQFRLFS